MDQDLRDQYKEKFGKFPRKDWDESRVRERLGITESDVDNTAEIAKAAEATVTKSETKKVVEDTTDELPLKKGKLHLVYFRGSARYWTNLTLNVMIRTHGNEIELPEGSEYQPRATVKRCKNCG